MAKMKSTKKYYFTVEGETEQWYLQWLQKTINESPQSKYKVSFDCPIQKDPLKRARSIVVLGKTEIYHLSDYESDEEIHVKAFIETMDAYKHEANFKKVLGKLGIDHVMEAVNRSKIIMERNKQNGYMLQKYKGYSYYKENPSLGIGEVIEKILKECGLI